MTKGFASILIVVLIAVAALGGYFIYQKQGKPISTPQPTLQLTPSPSDANPVLSGPLEIKALELKPLTYSFFTNRFLDLLPYPKEMISLSRGALKNLACSEHLVLTVYGDAASGFEVKVYDDKSEYSPNVIPSRILEEILKKEYPVSILFCDAGNSYIVLYQVSKGGSDSIDIVAKVIKEPFLFADIAKIEADTSYFGCHAVHALTINNMLYIQCGGGDVDYSQSIYRINLANNTKAQILNCRSQLPGDGTTFDICIDEKGSEIYRSKVRNFP